MAEPTFASADRRSLAMPLLLALGALVLAAALAIHLFPATSVRTAHVHTDVVPVAVKFGSSSMVVGSAQVESTLFIVETMRVENKTRAPIYLDDLNLTLTDSHHAQLTTNAAKTADLPALLANFAALRPLLQHPLLRETTVEPGRTVEGEVLFSLPLPREIWDTRSDAVVKTSFYHLSPDYFSIPK